MDYTVVQLTTCPAWPKPQSGSTGAQSPKAHQRREGQCPQQPGCVRHGLSDEQRERIALAREALGQPGHRGHAGYYLPPSAAPWGRGGSGSAVAGQGMVRAMTKKLHQLNAEVEA